MKKQALVSIIMPAFNAEKFIGEAIESISAQSWRNWELIVIDDASEDRTSEIIKNFSREESRIQLIENSENMGAGKSRNLGIEKARGEFIAFLDADDLWKANKLETQVNFMQQNDLGVSFSSYERIDEDGKHRREIVEALPFLTYQKLLRANYVGNLTGIYWVRKTGKIFGPEIRKRQDWGLWLAAIKKGGTAKSIREPLAIYRKRQNSVSGNKWDLLKYNFRIYHRVLGFSFFKSLKCMGMFLKEHFFVKQKQVKALE
ncbi:glycosyltransferase family 2 protein [Salegentibacter sp. HM20]